MLKKKPNKTILSLSGQETSHCPQETWAPDLLLLQDSKFSDGSSSPLSRHLHLPSHHFTARLSTSNIASSKLSHASYHICSYPCPSCSLTDQALLSILTPPIHFLHYIYCTLLLCTSELPFTVACAHPVCPQVLVEVALSSPLISSIKSFLT